MEKNLTISSAVSPKQTPIILWILFDNLYTLLQAPSYLLPLQKGFPLPPPWGKRKGRAPLWGGKHHIYVSVLPFLVTKSTRAQKKNFVSLTNLC